jgi:hypothetical protein
MPRKKRKLSEEHKRKISQALKGKTPKNFSEFQKKGLAATRKLTGEKSHNWKGSNVGYGALHQWVRKELGKPSKCERCGSTEAKRYEWANISLESKRDLSDWERLCVSCHRKEGFKRGEYTSWNKGTNTQTNTGRTHIKPGQHLSPETQFKKGHIPWNKYLEPRPCKQCNELFQPKEDCYKYCCRRCYWDSLKKS